MIGVGDPACGDDAAGRELVRRLRLRRLPAGTRVLESDGEIAALLEAWRGSERVILVDAASGGGVPGTLHRFEVSRPLPAALLNGSTHALGVAEAVELARSLGELPSQLTVYAIEGRSFEHGMALSLEVDRALDRLLARVLAELGG